MDAQDIEEVYTIRVSLETLAALQQLVQQFVRNRHPPCSSQEAWTQSAIHRRSGTLNYLFQLAIYRAAHMHWLMRLIEPHWLRISPFLWSLIEDLHMDALRSIEARNASGLEDAISVDILEAKRGLLQFLASR
jgi:DNA-binding GntR family transcriptional regulator